jgi:hypothetical protein
MNVVRCRTPEAAVRTDVRVTRTRVPTQVNDG